MKRREFLSGVSVSVFTGSAGCIDVPDGIVPDDSNSSDGENTPPKEGLYFGTENQIDFRIFDVDRNFDQIDSSVFRYNGESYSLEEFGTIVATDSLVDEVRQDLTTKGVLPDPNILVDTSKFGLSEALNPEIRSDIEIQRDANKGVVIEYIMETDNNNVIADPETELQTLIDQTPSSGSGFVQFEQRPYECTIPIGVRVVTI